MIWYFKGLSQWYKGYWLNLSYD